MKLSGKQEFRASPKETYERLLDPDLLRECMPGCERLDPVGPGRFDLTFGVPIPALKGTFDGTVQILDQAPPESFRMKIEATGKPGFVNADARVRIEPNGPTSIVHYDADAQIGGAAAAVGQRVITGISRRQVEQMFKDLEAGERAKKGPLVKIKAFFARLFGKKDKS